YRSLGTIEDIPRVYPKLQNWIKREDRLQALKESE
ncbi:hypothetical protein LCGC14_2682440, partial [marine sediment metagenome]